MLPSSLLIESRVQEPLLAVVESHTSAGNVRDDVVVCLVDRVDERVERHIALVNGLMVLIERLLDEREQWAPKIFSIQDDRHPADLLGLDERHYLEEFVERTEAAREVDIHLGSVGQHHLTHEEVVEAELLGEIRIVGLDFRQIDIEPDGGAADLEGALVGRLHDARGAAGDDGEPFLREPAREFLGARIRVVPERRSRAAEEGYGETVAADDVETLDELRHDLKDAPGFYLPRLTDQERTVLGHRAPALVDHLCQPLGSLVK